MSSDRAPWVFISYSHDSKDHAERVLALADRLRQDGVDAWIDQYEPVPARGWPRWMEEQVERADFVLCVCTETYRRRFDQQEAPERGLGVTWEGALLRIRLYLGQGENRQLLPVIFEPASKAHIPLPLQAFSYFQPTTSEGYDALYRHLTGQPEVEAPPLGQRRPRPPRPRRSLLGEPVDTEGPLDAYAAWAQSQYSHLEACAPCGAVAGGTARRICGRRSASGSIPSTGTTASAFGCCARPRARTLDP